MPWWSAGSEHKSSEGANCLMCVTLYSLIFSINCSTTSGYFTATFSLSFGSEVTLNSHVSDGLGEGGSIDPFMCTQPLGQFSSYLLRLADMLQFGWPTMSFQSPTRMAACPINPLRGGSRFIKIS